MKGPTENKAGNPVVETVNPSVVVSFPDVVIAFRERQVRDGVFIEALPSITQRFPSAAPVINGGKMYYRAQELLEVAPSPKAAHLIRTLVALAVNEFAPESA